MSPARAVIFDLDGVLADTARLHHEAWCHLAMDLGISLDDSTGQLLKGVSREASLDLVLRRSMREYSQSEKTALAEQKNRYYLQALSSLSPSSALPGARAALVACHDQGLRTALASGSRNAQVVIERLELAPLFNAIVDAGSVTYGKPAPDIFLCAARLLNATPTACVALEDSMAGIRAIKSAGMVAVGVGARDPLSAAGADFVIADIAAFAEHTDIQKHFSFSSFEAYRDDIAQL